VKEKSPADERDSLPLVLNFSRADPRTIEPESVSADRGPRVVKNPKGGRLQARRINRIRIIIDPKDSDSTPAAFQCWTIGHVFGLMALAGIPIYESILSGHQTFPMEKRKKGSQRTCRSTTFHRLTVSAPMSYGCLCAVCSQDTKRTLIRSGSLKCHCLPSRGGQNEIPKHLASRRSNLPDAPNLRSKQFVIHGPSAAYNSALLFVPCRPEISAFVLSDKFTSYGHAKHLGPPAYHADSEPRYRHGHPTKHLPSRMSRGGA